jgi:translocation and assembly module TamB
MRAKRVALIGGAVVAVVAALALAGVLVVTNTDWGREQVRTRALSALRQSVHGHVQLGRVSGNLLRGITLHDLRITDSSGAPFIVAQRVEAGYALRPLISRRIVLDGVEIDSAEIVIERSAARGWNYDRLFPRDSAQPADTSAGFGDWIVLTDVSLRRSRLTVRIPWQPDSSLRGAARDSAMRAALAGEGRTVVTRVADGTLQQVQDFRHIDARLPLVRVAQPEHPTKLIRADSLRMEAFAFAPPSAQVRQLSGEFELDGDSVWFRDVAVQLPASRAALTGRYEFVHGDLVLHTVASPVALRDVQFLYPALPDHGSATFDLALDWSGNAQRYVVKQLDLTTDSTRVRGNLGIVLGDTLRFHDTSLAFEALPTSLIEQLVPGLDVPREGVLRGRAIIAGTADTMQVDGDITFDDRRSGRSRVVAMGELGAVRGVFRAHDLHVTLAPLQMDLARIASPDLPVGGTLTGDATMNGRSDGLLEARAVDLVHLDRGARSRVTGRAAMRGASLRTLWLDADLQARPLSLVTVGRFAPAAELRGAVSGPIRAIGPLSALQIDSRLRSTDGGQIAARGTLDLVSRDIGYALDVHTVLFNANELSARAPRTSLSAFIATRARGIDPATLRGTFAADLLASSLDTVALDSLHLRASAANGLLSLDALRVAGAGATLAATGSFGLVSSMPGTLDFHVRVDSLGLLRRYLPPSDSGKVPPRPLRTAERVARARDDSVRQARQLAVARAVGEAAPAEPVHVDTSAGIPRDSVAGSFTLDGRASGNINAFGLFGTLDAKQLVVQGNAVQRARADIRWTGVRTDSATLAVQLNADSVSTAGFQLDSVATTLRHRAPGGSAQVAVYQNEARDYTLKADYALFTDRRELTLNDLRLRFDTTLWTITRPGAIRWGQPGVFVDSLDLRSGVNGRVFAHGMVPSEGAADLRLIVQNFQLGDLLGLLQSDVEGRGRLMLDARLTGSGRAPQIAGTMALLDARYRGTRVPEVQSRYSYSDRLLDLRAQLADSARGLERPTADLVARLPVDLAFSGVTGSRLLDAPATADLRADSLPLDLVSRFTDALSNVRGAATGTATLRGTLRDPTLAGAMALNDASTRVTALGITLDRLNGALRLQGDTVLIDSLTGWSRGRIALQGGVGIKQLATPSFDLQFVSEGARVLDNEQGRVRADARITAKGPFNDVLVQGRVRIRDGVLRIPEADQKEVISAGDPTVFAVVDTGDARTRELVPAQSPLLANLRMDLTLGVDRDTWVRSPEANVEIYSEDDLRITVDRRRSSLALDGVINTDRGEYEFLSKRFQIKRGAVQFIGTQEINPLLQITGEYDVKQATRPALAIRILIGGTLRTPRLTLESDAQPPISQSDLLSYLAFGSESGSLLQFGGSSLAGGTSGGGLVGTSAALATRQLTGVALGVAVDELEGQAARSLGADVFTITPANVPTELASGNFGGLTTFLKGTQFEFGKYLATRTFVGLQLQATTTPGFRVEHRLGRNPGLTLETSLQPRFFLPEPSLSEQEITKANAFGLFLVRRWRF